MTNERKAAVQALMHIYQILGLALIFVPDADVLTNTDNAVIVFGESGATENFKAAYEAVLDAVQSGSSISEDQIESSVTKFIKAKLELMEKTSE